MANSGGKILNHPILKHNIQFYKIERAENDSSSFTMPFSRAGNLILLKAKVDSIEGNFVLDTGCPGLVLNITYFRDYPRTSEVEDDNKGITGAVANVEHTSIYEFNFGTLNLFNTKADLINLGHIENTKGVKILGLIGMSFIEDCEMIIDFENSLIHFHIIAKKEAKSYRHKMLSDTTKYNAIPFDVTDNRIIVTTAFGIKKMKLIIDCAAETNVLDSRLPNSVLNNLAITGRVLLTGVGNKKIEALKGEIKDFKIGTKKVESLPFIVTNLEKTCFSYTGCVDGILGFDFLSLQKIGFNFVTRQMYIWK
ncbi:MAG: hypothetical protein ACOVO1_04410 [Chitinophagaceae bacterium]